MLESDPDDGEINDVDEFLREVDQIDYDETLVDLVGRGYDVNAPGDQAVADLLGAWRDDVESKPAPQSVERVQEIHELDQQYNAPPTQGGTSAMSLSDVIARLQMVASNSSAAEPLAQAKAKLDTEVVPLMQQAVQQLIEIKNAGVAQLEGNVNTHSELSGAAEHAAGAIEDAFALVQQAATGVEQATQHEAAFRQTALDIANRLSG